MTVSEMIKQTRKDHGMTQEEFGLKFGVSRQTVSSWENNRSIPDLQMLIDICNTYGISLDKLLNENNDFVEKIDNKHSFFNYTKYVITFAVIVLLCYGGLVLHWKIHAEKANKAYASTATQLGFEFKDKHYKKTQNQVLYELPNQSRPFLKYHFYAGATHATYETDDIIIEFGCNDVNSIYITFARNSYDGTITKDNQVVFNLDSFNKRDFKAYQENQALIEDVFQNLNYYFKELYKTNN